ncbi:hypothetical protein F5882DRAFT_524651 [Hyaloscypha sp. PMI_1271]|nr:hypothetical protein F5882DRAFT_524651 [Hyaloscypha sp. PMI_1271]
MSQRRSQYSQHQQRSWRGDPDIISMETRILPKNVPPTASKATRALSHVEIPNRNCSQSSATPPMFASGSLKPSKRPQSSDATMDPTPSKRHRIDILPLWPTPKPEPDQTVDTTPAPSDANASANEALADSDSNSAIVSTAQSMLDSVAASSIRTSNTEQINLSYARNLGAETIFFRFGDQILPSFIHRKVLCDAIPAFKEELKRLQRHENILDFPEELSDTFEALIEWCYKSKLPEVTKTTSTEECYIRIKLYCLAAAYGEIKLMNESMDFIMAYLRNSRPRWDVKWCAYAYANTNRGSPLRALVAKWFLHKFATTKDKSRWTTEQFSEVALAHPDMVFDVFSLMRKTKIKAKNPKKNDPSDYHVTPTPIYELSPNSQANDRADTPTTLYEAYTPEPVDGSINTPMEPTPPVYSDSEMEAVEDGEDSDFDEETEETASERVEDHLPLTRSSGKQAKSKNRAFTAPA